MSEEMDEESEGGVDYWTSATSGSIMTRLFNLDSSTGLTLDLGSVS